MMIQRRILIDNPNPLLPEGIRLDITRNISIPNDVLRLIQGVNRPSGHRPVQTSLRPTSGPSIGIACGDETGPALAHDGAEIPVALALVLERRDRVAQPVEVVEHEADFLEVRDPVWEGDAGGLCVEAVAVGGDVA